MPVKCDREQEETVEGLGLGGAGKGPTPSLHSWGCFLEMRLKLSAFLTYFLRF